jgi:hypothetical protein
MLVGEAGQVEAEDPPRAAALLLDAAVAYMETADMPALADTAARARRLFEHSNAERAALAAVQLAQAQIAMGLPQGLDLLAAQERYLLELDPLAGAHELITMVAVCWSWIEEYDRADRLLEHILSAARAATALRALPLPLAAEAQLAVRRGSWTAAEPLATEADDLAAETRSLFVRPFTLYCRAQLDALRGREPEARSRLALAREISLTRGIVATMYHVEATLGQLELVRGRLPDAIAALEAAQRIYTAGPPRRAGAVPEHPGPRRGLRAYAPA